MEQNAATTSSGSDKDSPQQGQRSEAQWHSYWEKQITAADKRLRQWRKRGNRIVSRYQGYISEGGAGEASRESSQDGPSLLNLFHSGVLTKQSMLCGQKPETDVSRQFADPDDDVARVAALLLQRMLDSDNAAADKDLKSVLAKGLQDRLLPGAGFARVRYAYGTTTVTVPSINGAPEQEVEQISWEDAPIDYVHWQDFSWGWCRSWAEMPWMAFRSFYTRGEVVKRWGEIKARELEYKKQSPSGEQGEDHGLDDQKNNVEKAAVYEIWQRSSKKVFYYSPGAGVILEEREDPLKLDDFWPAPKGLFANLTNNLLEPTADFMLAQDLYNEIDVLQTRISILTQAVKAVGTYDASAGEAVSRMLTEARENELIPVDNWAMFAEKGGLQGVTDWFPVKDIVDVISTLQSNRDQAIQLLYEVTGMSDILRGANTDQYVSDGTNQMKAKYGSIRIQALQDDFARWASELQALKAEVISKHFTPKSIATQANARYLPQADAPLMPKALELIKSPDIKWRTKIKPESIAMMDYDQTKSERIEWVTAVATYVQSVQAAAKDMPGALPLFLEILKWTMAGFKGSDVLEGIFDQAIKQLRDNPPGQNDQQQQAENIKLQTEQLKAQQVQMKLQGEIQKVKLKAQADLQTLRFKHQTEMAKLMAEQKGDMTLAQRQHMMNMMEIDRDLQTRLQEIAAELDADLQREEMQSAMAIAEENVEHAHTMRQLAYQGRQHETQEQS